VRCPPIPIIGAEPPVLKRCEAANVAPFEPSAGLIPKVGESGNQPPRIDDSLARWYTKLARQRTGRRP